jgi:NADPH-dependent 2,4-dienoyl-CoA reductase/sulfur reductase-like enzyme
MHLLIIGGSDAGISAALRAHELDPGAEVTIAVADEFPNFSICGLPYYLSGETPDWRDLAHHTQFPGINVLRQHKAESVDVARKSVAIKNAMGEKIVRYDHLIVATGATPIRPNLPGAALDGVFLLHTMDDSFAVHRHLTERQAERAVPVGAGYIGLEMADALKQRGLDVTLLSRSKTVLPAIDPALGLMIGEELERNGVRVLTSVSAMRIDQAADGKQSQLSVTRLCQWSPPSGPRHLRSRRSPKQSDLTHKAGVKLGANGAIAITRHMETNLPDVFAAGDCVETYHRLLDRPTYISLGTIAHKQGRVAGETTATKQADIDAAQNAVDTLNAQLDTAQFRHDYFQGLLNQDLNTWESLQADSSRTASAIRNNNISAASKTTPLGERWIK